MCGSCWSVSADCPETVRPTTRPGARPVVPSSLGRCGCRLRGACVGHRGRCTRCPPWPSITESPRVSVACASLRHLSSLGLSPRPAAGATLGGCSCASCATQGPDQCRPGTDSCEGTCQCGGGKRHPPRGSLEAGKFCCRERREGSGRRHPPPRARGPAGTLGQQPPGQRDQLARGVALPAVGAAACVRLLTAAAVCTLSSW